ncbi:MAG: hypothetical protein A2831_00745 [Candidatus Yanofskybacteria bacterium RIFCSPHIGHO2_01_FULL_44_17]|uniref:Bacterial transcriptional activator domain-containing protein n=1 Tax=Candidatus Yanofskybacteria bacterium RIFCSPHIGHO2_01_FULL_44_17 TaxID=1802668 RepID=A0A1F8EUI5_9BACT|nr:MAG: hypothetical protein A2831_00745 [Candidatus Yanofskybacteria bacterium RIFCSPHIGHO2_01_FULL_44_17]
MLEIPVSLERKDLRTRLVESLAKMRESGGIDHEVARLLDEWTKEKEEAVPANQPERNKAAILLNVERARLYRDAGYIEEAIENYEAALTQLENEQDRESVAGVSEIIYTEIDQLPRN